jgi:hypothetical protein
MYQTYVPRQKLYAVKNPELCEQDMYWQMHLCCIFMYKLSISYVDALRVDIRDDSARQQAVP